jgi:hypothetical protein
MPKIIDRWIGHRRMIRKLEVKSHKFRAFVDFVHENFSEGIPITPKEIVKMQNCPVRDEETASKYLSSMQKARLHLKSIITHGKVYFIGCTPEEEAALKRIGFEGWAGEKTTEFFRKRRLFGRIILERIYRFQEYGEPLFPNLAMMFPQVNDIFTTQTS